MSLALNAPLISQEYSENIIGETNSLELLSLYLVAIFHEMKIWGAFAPQISSSGQESKR
jgi:hypothetical protein